MPFTLPKLGLGTNWLEGKVELSEAKRIVATALDEGITFFDTAEIYNEGESESVLGLALQGRRQNAIIATKFKGSSDPAKACEASLKRLRTDYIDLYQMHDPGAPVPIERTLEILAGLVDQGKVRQIGNCNFAGWQIADADWTSRLKGWPKFVTAQNRYNLLERTAETDVVPACHHFGLGLIAYAPLAAGLLSGKYRRSEPPPAGTRLAINKKHASRFLKDSMFDKVDALQQFADSRGTSLLSVAISGLAALPGIPTTLIASASRAEQVLLNVNASRWAPSDNDVEEIRRLTEA